MTTCDVCQHPDDHPVLCFPAYVSTKQLQKSAELGCFPCIVIDASLKKLLGKGFFPNQEFEGDCSKSLLHKMYSPIRLIQTTYSFSKDGSTNVRQIIQGAVSQPRPSFLGVSLILGFRIETSNETEYYVALSHCPGKSQTFVPAVRNLAERKKGISWASLPKTFQDAILVTRALDIQYIWMGSICRTCILEAYTLYCTGHMLSKLCNEESFVWMARPW